MPNKLIMGQLLECCDICNIVRLRIDTWGIRCKMYSIYSRVVYLGFVTRSEWGSRLHCWRFEMAGRIVPLTLSKHFAIDYLYNTVLLVVACRCWVHKGSKLESMWVSSLVMRPIHLLWTRHEMVNQILSPRLYRNSTAQRDKSTEWARSGP